MDVTVNMTAEELVEFLEFRKERGRYKYQTERLGAQIDRFVVAISEAIDPDPEKPGKYKIRNQSYADELWLLAENCGDDE